MLTFMAGAIRTCALVAMTVVVSMSSAMPLASLRLLVGLWAMPAPALFSPLISPSSTCTQWAARTLASKRPCFFTHGTTGIP